MAGTTPSKAFPYPTTSDPPNGPAQIQALAQAVENEMLAPTGDINLTAAARIRWNADTEISRRAAGQLTTPGMSLFAPPYLWAYQTAIQTLTSTVAAAIGMGGELADTAAGHSTGLNPSRYTPPIPGRYDCDGGVLFAGSTAGDRSANFRVNGAQVEGAPYGSAGALNGAGFVAGYVTCAASVFLNGTTDYVELWAVQNVGGNLDTFSSGFNKSWMRIRWVGHA